MDQTQKNRLKLLIEKLIGRSITDTELDKIISSYASSFRTGEERLAKSISEATNLSSFLIETKIAASDDTERIKNDLVNLLNQGKDRDKK